MSSKRLFSWQKRQSNVEPYYKTGGLLSIDDLEGEPSNGAAEAKVRVTAATAGGELAMRNNVFVHEEVVVVVGRGMRREAAGCFVVMTVYSLTCCKDTQKARRRPSNLTIIPPENQHPTTSPLSSPYNARRISSTSNLMALFNDLLRSPTLSAAAYPRSPSIQKPLPTRPRSSSVPSPDLPVELPGSLLQQNQGFPYFETPDFVLSRPTSQNVRRGTHPPDICAGDEGDIFDLLHLFPEPLNHSRSVPSMHSGFQESAMKSSHSGTAPNVSPIKKSKTHSMHHRKALSDIEWSILTDSEVTNNSQVVVSSAPKHANASHDLNKLPVDSDNLSQLSPLVTEVEASNNIFDRRASRRDDVSTSCSFALVFTRRVRAMHDETVSDRLHSPCSP